MCGIVGFVNLRDNVKKNLSEAIIKRMTDSLYHRGPDDSGIWIDEKSKVFLGHRRLSIIDVTCEGHQPMTSLTGRLTIVFNGEIYNYLDLRTELVSLGCKFTGFSDTEVMLVAIEKWGLLEALNRFIGMFAFALWDSKERKLFLGRDRIGKKPLYFAKNDDIFIFASELKAMRENPSFNFLIDRDALALFLRFNNVPAPYSIYKNIFKLCPGKLLCFEPEKINKEPEIISYWSAKEAIEKSKLNNFSGSCQEAAISFEKLLSDAVKLRMISDVPLGAFMSGGIDSSLNIALMQAQSSSPVKTFTIGFNEIGYNEAENAKEIAKILGTDHTELYITATDALKSIPLLPSIYDEPFADSSQIPTYLISKLTREHVTVAISGDGGDELFAGYNRYYWVRKIWDHIRIMPDFLKPFVSKTISSLPIDYMGNLANKFISPKKNFQNLGFKLMKIAEVIKLKSPEDIYFWLISHCKNPAFFIKGAIEIEDFNVTNIDTPKLDNFVEKMMFLDLIGYLPNDILTKVDRASMGVSLEVRAPLLDHRVVEFAWTLPLTMKIYKNETKWLLKQILYKYIPKQLVNRPKMGFSIPVNIWLRSELKEWAQYLLSSKMLDEGLFNKELIRKKWTEHLTGKYNWQDCLWPVLMFQAWKEKWA